MTIPIIQQNIIGILGIESLPDEEKISIINKVTELVQKRLMVSIFDSLDKLRQREFTEILEAGEEQKIQEFVERFVPNITKLVESEIDFVKQELADWAAKI